MGGDKVALMSEREIIKIAVTPESKKVIDRLSQRYGMSQIELASRLYNWFGRQDEVLQAAILDLLPDSMAPDIVRLALERIDTEPDRERAAAAKAARPAVHATTRLPGPPKRRERK